MIHIKKVVLEQARPYDLCQIQPKHQLNVLFGDNGVGKTTVLESIYIALTGKSFKSHRLKEFIQDGKAYAKIQIFLDNDEDRNIWIKPRSKELHKNGAKVRSLSEFCQGIACVALIPEHIAMVNNSAEARRKYMDHILFFNVPSFAQEAQHYKKAYAQKLSLLKAKLNLRDYLDQVAPWNAQLIELSALIRQKRHALIEGIKADVSHFYKTISQGHSQMSLAYVEHEEHKPSSFQDKLSLEHRLGRSLWGCHKDDLQLNLNGKSMGIYASQGERASCLLALKCAELKSIEKSHQNIVLLLDDIGGTLDQERRHILIDWLSQQQYQTFMSTADHHIEQTSQEIGAAIYHLNEVKHVDLAENLRIVKWQTLSEGT